MVFLEFSVTEGGRTFFPVLHESHYLALTCLHLPSGLSCGPVARLMCPSIHSAPGHFHGSYLTYLAY